MANSYYLNGQYRQSRKMPSPDYTAERQANVQPPQNGNLTHTVNRTVKPVKASEVAEETMKRADDYVNEKIETFKKSISGIPKDVPVTISDEVDKKLNKFGGNVTKLEEQVDRVKDLVEKNDKWRVKSLLFNGIFTLMCIVLAWLSGANYYEGNERISMADREKAHADSVIDSVMTVLGKNDTYRDFGLWMVNRYGNQGVMYNDFLKEYNRNNKK